MTATPLIVPMVVDALLANKVSAPRSPLSGLTGESCAITVPSSPAR